MAVVLLVLFAIAIMDGVTARVIDDPLRISLIVGLAFIAYVSLQAVGSAVFSVFGRDTALSVGFSSGNRNMAPIAGGSAGRRRSGYPTLLRARPASDLRYAGGGDAPIPPDSKPEIVWYVLLNIASGLHRPRYTAHICQVHHGSHGRLLAKNAEGGQLIAW